MFVCTEHRPSQFQHPSRCFERLMSASAVHSPEASGELYAPRCAANECTVTLSSSSLISPITDQFIWTKQQHQRAKPSSRFATSTEKCTVALCFENELARTVRHSPPSSHVSTIPRIIIIIISRRQQQQHLKSAHSRIIVRE